MAEHDNPRCDFDGRYHYQQADSPCNCKCHKVKKPYEKPTLTVLGSLTDLTKGTGHTGRPDNASHHHKT